MQKVKDYIKFLQELVEEHPEAAEWMCILPSDDEGNDYRKAYYKPQACIYVSRDTLLFDEDEAADYDMEYKPNAVVF